MKIKIKIKIKIKYRYCTKKSQKSPPGIFFKFPNFQHTQKRDFSCIILSNIKTKSDYTFFLIKVKT
jgi:hypothetical protein